jgi:hypothetical protein
MKEIISPDEIKGSNLSPGTCYERIREYCKPMTARITPNCDLKAQSSMTDNHESYA